jgi:hypothetical protein
MPLIFRILFVVAATAFVPAARAESVSLPDNDVMMRALVDELDRSMKSMMLEDLPKPYFIQFRADDRLNYSIVASYGGLVQSSKERSRRVLTRIRVGNYEFDNTNFLRSFGSGALLPIEDDYTAIRHAVWSACDRDYKGAVETLAQKAAYLRTKQEDEERPVDYTPAEPVVHMDPTPELAFDAKVWEGRIKQLSERFARYPDIQESGVSLAGGVVNQYTINSEGTRLRVGDKGIIISAQAQLQAADGMLISDSVTFLGEEESDLPSLDDMLARIDKLCTTLTAIAKGPVLEQYTGPVLFEPEAAGVVFESLLADGLAARPVPVGGRGGSDSSMERKLGLRILPRTFNVVDDAGPKKFDGTLLLGSYRFDDEAVRPKRVSLVERGILKNLLAGRAPTKKVSGSTGHARTSGFGDPQATPSCLYFEDEAAISRAELQTEFLTAAQEEGLEYGIRVESLEPAGGGLGDPIVAYKVYVADGREEPIRGCEFLPVQVRALKRLVACSKEREVYNSLGGVGMSIISPAILMDELELTKIVRELDKLPILKSPATR